MKSSDTNRAPGPVVTSKGIVIGLAYQRPAPRLGSEAERIQAALLTPLPIRPAVWWRVQRAITTALRDFNLKRSI